MTGEVRVTTLSDAAGTGPATLTGQEGAKVRGMANTSASLLGASSLNISSLTDLATGYIQWSMTSAFVDRYYTIAGIPRSVSTPGANFTTIRNSDTPTASSVKTQNYSWDGNTVDCPETGLAAFGDLA